MSLIVKPAIFLFIGDISDYKSSNITYNWWNGNLKSGSFCWFFQIWKIIKIREVMSAQIKRKTVFFALLGWDYSKTWSAGAVLRPDLDSTGKATLKMTPIFSRTNSTFFLQTCVMICFNTLQWSEKNSSISYIGRGT